MSLWEYKVITSGKGGFATPALLEKFLNDLGRDEWEIVCFQTAPDNFLAFTGLARRSTQRDWTLEDAAAAAAKAEAEKLRAEFEAKFKAANQPAVSAEERPASFLEEKLAPDDGFRKPVDTSRDDEPEAADEEKDEWDKLEAEDELPTFFDAIKPHMRRNQRGPGMSVGVDYLAKKWDQTEDDLKGALAECGFVVPADEDTKPEYVEYDGDLYWLNINRRGELWINTKEKPRPVFRSVKAQKVAMEEEAPRAQAPQSRQQSEAAAEAKPEGSERRAEGGESAEGQSEPAEGQAEGGEAKPAGGKAPLPEGPALLQKIRPHMRRNRRGPGGSGSSSFLARALRTNEADLKAAFVALGLTMPATPTDKPVYTEINNELWWLNIDSRGGLWINGREKRASDSAPGTHGEAAAGETPAPAEATPGAAAPDAVPTPEIAPSVSSGGESSESSGAGNGAEANGARSSAEATEREREVAPMPADTSTGFAATAPQSSGAAEAGQPSAAGAGAMAAGEGNPVLASVRPHLKETRTGGTAAKADRLADELGKSVDEVIAMLVGTGLKAPEKAREKPVYVEHAGEVFWLNKSSRGELWLNAKAAQLADKSGADDEAEEGADAGGEAGESTEGSSEGGEGEAEKKPRRGRGRSKKAE